MDPLHSPLDDFDNAMVSIALPPAKRARFNDSPIKPTATIVFHQPTTTSSTTTLTLVNERLHSVLSKGVFKFLPIDSVAAVLSTCRLTRNDPQLVAACVRDRDDFAAMFPEDPQPMIYRLPRHWVQTLVGGAPQRPGQVVSSAAFLKKRVLHWCFDYEPQNRLDEDLLCSVRPVLIPLANAPESVQPTWTRQPIQEALNRVCDGGGDAFFDPKCVSESGFASHWDSVYIDRVSGRVSCRLCVAVCDSLAQYKRQVELALRQFGLILRHKEASWKGKTPEEITTLKTEFRAKYFAPDAYVRPECLEWPEAKLLRHIYEHGNFQTWQIGDTRARGIASADALLKAVSHQYQHQCRTFYQPLKKSLQRKYQLVGRIPHATLQRTLPPKTASNSPLNETTHRELTEVVGGVELSSGIFCGVQVSFRLRR